MPHIRIGNLTVLGLALREGDPDGAIERLTDAIDAAPGPVIVAGHYPIIETRSFAPDEPFGARGYVEGEALRLQRLLASREHVIAYLCGHVHLTSLADLSASCVQSTAGGLGPGAAAFRVYDWDGSALAYSTRDVEGPTTFWESGFDEARLNSTFSTGNLRERAGVHHPSSLKDHT